MSSIQNPFRSFTLATVTFLLAASTAHAAGPSRDIADAQSRYRQDMAVCNSGQSQQSVETCRIEARNALAEARRGKSTAAPEQLYPPNEFAKQTMNDATAYKG